MRGKTNATDGVHLNATTENMEVGSGQIIAGDFVQYCYEDQYIEQSSMVQFYFNMGDYVIGLKNNNIVLFKENELLDTYSDYNISVMGKYGNFILAYSHSAGKCIVLSINTTTHKLVFVDEISIQLYSLANEVFAICGGNNKVVIYAGHTSSSGSQYRQFGTLDISNAGELSNAVLTSQEYTSKYSNPQIEYYDEQYYFIARYGQSHIIYDLTINNDGTVSCSNGQAISGVCQLKIYQHDNVVVYTSENYAKITIVNLSGKTSRVADLNGGTVTQIVNDYFVTNEKSSGKRILRLYKYDDETDEVSLVFTTSALTTKDTSGSYMGYPTTGYISNNFIIVYMGDSDNTRWYQIFKLINDNEIQKIPDTGKVMPYSVAGNPIGIAQTDGNVGDTIPIYVPQMNV